MKVVRQHASFVLMLAMVVCVGAVLAIFAAKRDDDRELLLLEDPSKLLKEAQENFGQSQVNVKFASILKHEAKLFDAFPSSDDDEGGGNAQHSVELSAAKKQSLAQVPKQMKKIRFVNKPIHLMEEPAKNQKIATKEQAHKKIADLKQQKIVQQHPQKVAKQKAVQHKPSLMVKKLRKPKQSLAEAAQVKSNAQELIKAAKLEAAAEEQAAKIKADAMIKAAQLEEAAEKKKIQLEQQAELKEEAALRKERDQLLKKIKKQAADTITKMSKLAALKRETLAAKENKVKTVVTKQKKVATPKAIVHYPSSNKIDEEKKKAYVNENGDFVVITHKNTKAPVYYVVPHVLKKEINHNGDVVAIVHKEAAKKVKLIKKQAKVIKQQQMQQKKPQQQQPVKRKVFEAHKSIDMMTDKYVPASNYGFEDVFSASG